MPTFCRHNRLMRNCPICSREQDVEMRPLISSGSTRSRDPQPSRSPPRAGGRSPRGRASRGSPAGDLRVTRLARGADDGYRSQLVPGLRSSAEAARLGREIAFAATRLDLLRTRPPGLYAEVAAPESDREERTWLAFLIAYLAPLAGEPDPFAEIARVRTAWGSTRLPDLTGVRVGPRAAHDPSRGTRTLEAYRAWADRAGSQHAAFSGEPGWAAQRRFARAFERLALPGLHRAARFELLVTLGALSVHDVSPDALKLGGDDEVTVAAKRALGIGDQLLLERRAGELATACGVPLAALDMALYNWERGERVGGGIDPRLPVAPGLAERIGDALGVAVSETRDAPAG